MSLKNFFNVTKWKAIIFFVLIVVEYFLFVFYTPLVGQCFHKRGGIEWPCFIIINVFVLISSYIASCMIVSIVNNWVPLD